MVTFLISLSISMIICLLPRIHHNRFVHLLSISLFLFVSQHKRHAQKATKYVELIIVADNREVRPPCLCLHMMFHSSLIEITTVETDKGRKEEENSPDRRKKTKLPEDL